MRRLILASLAVSLAACGATTPSGPSSPRPATTQDDRGQTVATLQSAALAWRVSHPASYRYVYRRSCFCLERGPVLVTVRAGRLESAVDAQTGEPLPPDGFLPVYTMDGLFALLFEAVDEGAWSIDATYDARLGFPVEVYIDRSAQMADEELGFSVSAFEAL